MIEVLKFRKKPVEIEAVHFDGTSIRAMRISNWADKHGTTVLQRYDPVDGRKQLVIPTLEGDMRAEVGDWIIKGIKGEFYPCKPDIFVETYQPAGGSVGGACGS